MRLSERIWARISGLRQAAPREAGTGCTHVVLMDGTMSSLTPGLETNVGLTYRLLTDANADGVRVHYEPGIQWRGLLHAHEVMAGIGINRQIKRAYRFLADVYEPGHTIVLIGYSRGAYAIRSLAGLIDRMGLIRADVLTEKTVEEVYHLYREAPGSPRAKEISARLCHRDVTIDFVGAYDTVRALGMRWPLVWRFLPVAHPFHSHGLGAGVRVARHALALDETRLAYAPILWDTTYAAEGQNVEQMWFAGTHGDVGGQIAGLAPVRKRSNISLVWMLEAAEAAGLSLPDAWRDRFAVDAEAPSVGNLRGFGKLFLSRRRRRVGQDASERVHGSVTRDLGLAPEPEQEQNGEEGFAPPSASPGTARGV